MLSEYKTIAAILEVKLKLLEQTLHQKLRNIHIEKVIEGYVCNTSDKNTIIRELKYANQLGKDLSSSSVV